jgi:hypothetical protein
MHFAQHLPSVQSARNPWSFRFFRFHAAFYAHVMVFPSHFAQGEGGLQLQVKKTLHTAQDKIYFVTNLRYLVLGVILSVRTLAGILAAETSGRRLFLGIISFWLANMEPLRCLAGVPNPTSVEGNTSRREPSG